MGMIDCEIHGVSGIALVSSDIAGKIKNREKPIAFLRYDIDWLGNGKPMISYCVSGDFRAAHNLPEPTGIFSDDFEDSHAVALSQLIPVCGKCLNELS